MWKDNDLIMSLFDKANEGKVKFPSSCPVCNNHSAHMYIHRHNDEHSGVWTWCSDCGASSHMSAKTPAWWKNPSFIDENCLCSNPDYLDKLAEKIDEWVNNIEPKEDNGQNIPFVMEDTFKVRFKADFQGIPIGTIGTIVIKNDFKTVEVDFISTDGKSIAIKDSPEDLTKVVEIIK